jgi:hypothetical protein
VLDLRPLIIVTGTIHVEGGERNRVRSGKRTPKNGQTQTRIVDRSVTADRHAANVIVVDYGRRLKQMALLRTPYGVLIGPETLDDLRQLIAASTKKIEEFNAKRKRSTTQLANYVLWENLSGVRQIAVAGWLEVQRKEKDEVVLAALGQLRITHPSAAV